MSRAAGPLRKAEGPAFPRGFLHKGDDPAARVYLRALDGTGRDAGRPRRCEVLIRHAEGTASVVAPTEKILGWAAAEGDALARHVAATLGAIAAERAPFAGLVADRPLVMGVINVTPDSFSDGGEFFEAGLAIEHGRRLLRGGRHPRFRGKRRGRRCLGVAGTARGPGAAECAPWREGTSFRRHRRGRSHEARLSPGAAA